MCAFTIGLGASAAFSVECFAYTSSVSVTLTPQQTLALYGQTIPAQYKDGDSWKNCTFSFYAFGNFSSQVAMPLTDYDLRGGQPSGFASWQDYIDNNIKVTPRLYYVCSTADANYTSPTEDELKLVLSPSIDISGISYYRQNFMFTKYSSANWRGDVYCASTVSYSASPIITYPNGWDNRETGYIESSFVGTWDYTSENSSLRWNLIDLYLDHLENGLQTEFSVSTQELHYGRSGVAYLPPDVVTTYYILSVQCPTVTEGYIVPEVTTTAPTVEETLSQLVGGQSEINGNLALILNKLDAIFEGMSGLSMPDPDTPEAQTIPVDLQQFYSGIATGAPSASAINDYSGGASLIPFSAILSASGLGGLFGLLVGIACAGWVLTRGRGDNTYD